MATAAKEKGVMDPKVISATKVELRVEEDRFHGVTLVRPKKEKDIGGTGMFDTASITPVYSRDERGQESYSLRVVYSGFGWMFLKGSLIFIVDGGNRIALQGPSSDGKRDVVSCSGSSCLLREEINVSITKEQLENISRAVKAEVRLDGRRAYMQGYLKEFHCAAIRAILDYAKTNSGPAAAQDLQ